MQKENGVKSTTNKLIEMLKELFAGKYDAYRFSIDFPDYCFINYEKLEKEYSGLGVYLDQEVPDICDAGEPGFDSTKMITELKKVYEKIIEIVA